MNQENQLFEARTQRAGWPRRKARENQGGGLLTPWVLASLLAMTACGHQGANEGSARIRVDSLVGGYRLTRVVVKAEPAGIERELHQQKSDTYEGTVILPSGPQSLTVQAYALDRSDAEFLVGEGTEEVDVIANGEIGVTLTILDTTGPRRQGAIIVSTTMDKTTTTLGVPIQLDVKAVNPTGGAVDCVWDPGSCVGVQFSDALLCSTTWTATTAQTCAVSVTVKANAQDQTLRGISLTALDGSKATGAVNIHATYSSHPEVTGLELSNIRGAAYWCRRGPDGTLPCDVVDPGKTLRANIFHDSRDETTIVELEDGCGGKVEQDANGFFQWTTPQTAGECLLIATVTDPHGRVTKLGLLVPVQ